ncbi:DUF3597 domain-containing protein [Glaciimonas immobilis]|uniref:DUF3597 domain-containing protein n=1 Tax=Glaciimonas immobilis TaxID=728004 RepID=A0A840RX89_9BURK|nr:DUF3597 domain-containing protein [Glaciimonas immobilis]KAF3996598.1 DUF3597 domain-containing protein [Glaciimonas immobilis]MBB5201029.1 hypothetical protein [Glaciimonas immobilis]
MGILSSIFQKIFPPSHPAVTQSAASGSTSGSSAAPAQPSSAGGSTIAPDAPAASQAIQEVDVENVLDAMPSAQQLNWRTSIVDLMKLLGLDSSLQSRTSLAHELNYSGDTSDSAAMNIWLHRQVMNKVAQNGGKVPADLKD